MRIPRLQFAFTLAIVLSGGVYIAGWVVIWLTRGSYLTAFIGFGAVALFLTFVLHLAYLMSGMRQPPRTTYGADGTVISTPMFANSMFTTGFVAGVPAAAAYLVCAPFGLVDYVPSGVLRVAVPSFCVFVVIFGARGLYRMSQHGSESYLRLDPRGFEVWSGYWGSFGRGNWEDIEQILDQPPRGRKVKRELIIFLRPKGRSPMLVADAVTADSVALREWVRFYWQHPECRVELTDGRGLQRLDEANFAAG